MLKQLSKIIYEFFQVKIMNSFFGGIDLINNQVTYIYIYIFISNEFIDFLESI